MSGSVRGAEEQSSAPTRHGEHGDGMWRKLTRSAFIELMARHALPERGF